MAKDKKTKRILDIPTRASKRFDKEKTKEKTASLLRKIDELQKVFYASGKHALLIVIQGLDAAGKDGLISTYVLV